MLSLCAGFGFLRITSQGQNKKVSYNIVMPYGVILGKITASSKT